MKGVVFKIEELTVHDGPGLRTTVFLKGCPLRCAWCHNPEGLSPAPELMIRRKECVQCGACLEGCSHPECAPFQRCTHACPKGLITVAGQEMNAQELAAALLKNADFLQASGGGVTFSGGEPLLQSAFLLEALSLLRGLHTAIQTSGYAGESVFRQVVNAVDYVMMDIKLADADAHRRYTGVGNETILSNLRSLQKCGKPFVIRTPLIPGITDTEQNLTAIRRLIGDSPWETLPYNTMAGAKYPLVGKPFPLDGRRG